MGNIIKNNYILNKFVIILIIILFNTSKEYNKEIQNLIDNYYSFYNSNITNIELGKYISGNIINDSLNFYSVSILNDSEQIFFDYQSEYGCLYIYVKQNDTFNSSEYDFIFCSEGIDSIFSLNKNDILDKIDEKERDTIKDLNIIIGVGYLNSEIIKNDYLYTLKVSLRKPDINIFEINSEHKLLCKTEKMGGINKCLFLINYNKDENENNIDYKNIVIYPLPQIKSIKLKIYADFIDKKYYDEWNKYYLINNIPNNLSNYNNYLLEQDFIYIPVNNKNKYIYICVESTEETTIEMITHMLYKNEEIKLPEINEMKIYSFNKSFISLDFNSLENKDISITLVTLNGKASIYWENDKTNKYITDIRENKLLLNYNINKNNSKLIINNLEYNEQNNDNELGYIFYIIYIQRNDYILNEFLYSKSVKLSLENTRSPIILYSQIPNINSPININLQLYNILESSSLIFSNIFNIDVALFSIKDIYKIRKDPSNIELNNTIKGNFDSALFASNIYLSIEDMQKFEIEENPWIFIYISSNDTNAVIEKLILGSSISLKDSLIYPSERIYHYGELNKDKKVVYKLGGKAKYNLMRLEIGINSYDIGWSVKRKNESINYKYNDTDLSFVTEKWYNGRSLITMYIERGEDIYLTIFNKDLEHNNLTNYIFKYVNAARNPDFNNYFIKDDLLNYNEETKTITVNPINNIQNAYVNYYLKIIEKNNYIKNEIIKTISIIQSNCTLSKKGNINNNQISFSFTEDIKKDIDYHINVYSHIIGRNDLDIEYIAYEGLVINIKSYVFEESNKGLIITSIVIAGFILLIILFRCCRLRIKRNRRLLYDDLHITNELLLTEI